MPGLWRNNPKTKGGKYLVQRRDGSVPEWPYMVFGARDPAASVALRAYADEAARLGYDADYVQDVRTLADQFDEYRAETGAGNPTAPPERDDDPKTVDQMKPGVGA